MSDTVQRILNFEARLKRTQARELAAAPAVNEAEREDNQERAARLLREVDEIEAMSPGGGA